MTYAMRAAGGEHGSVSTRREIAYFMLDLCGYVGFRDLSRIRVLDPGAGDGAFVIAAMQRLHSSARRFGFDFQRAVENLVAVEIDGAKSGALEARISGCMESLGVTGRGPRVIRGDFLAMEPDAFDVIVGNPPYVRYDNIPADKRKEYRRRFQCFRHRSDIYVAFFEMALDCLSGAGQLCFVCPDRWLKSRYGEKMRDLLSKRHGIPAVVNLDGIDAFEESVSSYPMIILINADSGLDHIKYFEARDMPQLNHIVPRRDAGRRDNTCRMIRKPRPGELWTFGGNEKIPGAFVGIEDQGFRIGIGVATGADSIFVGRGLAGSIERDRLVPIVLSGDISRGRINWSENYVFNPFGDGGALVNLEEYPLARKYLMANRERLSRRHVARKNPRNWYRTIDAINPRLAGTPKLLLPDMKKDRAVAMDAGQFYPHHNIYHITGHSVADLKVLGAVLMSDISLDQLDAVGMRMRGGYVRWQAQSLRRLALPPIRDMPDYIRDTLANLFDAKDAGEINAALAGYVRRQAVSIPE